MKIGIYARGLSQKGGGGVKEVIKCVTAEMCELVHDDDKLYIFHTLGRPYFASSRTNVREVLLRSKSKIISDFLLAPIEINRLRLDATWFPKNVVPYGIMGRRVVTVHDLGYFYSELDTYQRVDKMYMTRMIRSSCRRADGVIAISDSTKQDMVRILNLSPERIDVVHQAADERYCPIEDKEALRKVKQKYDLPERFVLFTGSITPRKNLLRLAQAFGGIENKQGYQLVLTGNKVYKTEKELAIIRNSPDIREIGFVADDEMPLLYNLSDIYIYPSLFEGFGIPVLEAQACGRPVISASSSSLPEVGGESVRYVDPYSVEDIRDAITALINDSELRSALVAKGFENVKRFSWKKTATETLRVLCGS